MEEGQKPWFELLNTDMYMSVAFSLYNHLKDPRSIKTITPIAFILILDGNMGGNYIRQIWWNDEHSKPFQEIVGNKAEIWGKDFKDLHVGDKIEYFQTGQTFVVHEKSTKYAKLFVLV